MHRLQFSSLSRFDKAHWVNNWWLALSFGGSALAFGFGVASFTSRCLIRRMLRRRRLTSCSGIDNPDGLAPATPDGVVMDVVDSNRVLHCLPEEVGVVIFQFVSAARMWQLRKTGRSMHELIVSWAKVASAHVDLRQTGAERARAAFETINVGSSPDLFALVVGSSRVLEIRDCAGRSLLMKAALLTSSGPVDCLLAARADLFARGGNGWTALHFAATSGSAAACESLVRHRADVDARSSDGYTPLFYAHRAGNDAVVVRLLRAGATPCSAHDLWGFTDQDSDRSRASHVAAFGNPRSSRRQ